MTRFGAPLWVERCARRGDSQLGHTVLRLLRGMHVTAVVAVIWEWTLGLRLKFLGGNQERDLFTDAVVLASRHAAMKAPGG